ncbi:MAG: DNA-processing protein DprA [Verrucomicrobiota bacterium]
MTETEACIAINMIPKMGPVRLRKLLEVFENPQRILSAKAGELRSIDGIGNEVASTIASWEEQVDLQAELDRITAFGAHVLTQQSPEYPRLLREIHNPPILLYVWGKLSERDRHAIGVVGSRRTSHYGLECAKKLSYQLAYSGITVVSGLARGIDTAAHQGALAAKGRTIAVLGSGLNRLYPPENLQLAEKIAQSGAVVSEFSMDVTADTQTFPMRNRIVSGWGTGVLVIEAGLNSGALITANQAVEQGRSVYAVPGQIDRPTAAGSNRLIQQGAKLVTGAGDILDDLQILLPVTPKLTASSPRSDLLQPVEKQIYDAINDNETAIDEIIAKTKLPTATVSSTLLALEMKRFVKQLPGQHFVKLL